MPGAYAPFQGLTPLAIDLSRVAANTNAPFQGLTPLAIDLGRVAAGIELGRVAANVDARIPKLDTVNRQPISQPAPSTQLERCRHSWLAHEPSSEY